MAERTRRNPCRRDGCATAAFSEGQCWKHLKEQRLAAGVLCSTPECTDPLYVKALCIKHWTRQRTATHGRTSYKVERTCVACGECWQTENRNGKFCSLACRDLWYMDHQRKPRERREAMVCVLPKDHPARWVNASSALAYGNCPECQAVWCQPPWGSKVYCSKRCRSRASSRRKIPQRKFRHKGRRLAILERDDYICWLCGDPCDRDQRAPHPASPTVDHVTPRSHGGGDEPENLACAHFLCNVTRRDDIDCLTYPSPLAA